MKMSVEFMQKNHAKHDFFRVESQLYFCLLKSVIDYLQWKYLKKCFFYE